MLSPYPSWNEYFMKSILYMVILLPVFIYKLLRATAMALIESDDPNF